MHCHRGEALGHVATQYKAYERLATLHSLENNDR